MTMTTARKLERIRRYSISLRRLAGFLFVITLLGAVVSLLFILLQPGKWVGPMDVIGIRFTGIAVHGTVRAFAALTVLLSAGVLARFFFHAIKLFGLYSQGMYFTAQSVAHIRQLGITLLLVPAVWLIGPLAVLVLGSAASPDAGVSLVSAPTGQLFSGFIVIFVSWLMEQDLVV
jgi:hypothetical protein